MKTFLLLLALARAPAGIFDPTENITACRTVSILMGVGLRCEPPGMSTAELVILDSRGSQICGQEVRNGPLFCWFMHCRPAIGADGWECWSDGH